MYNNQNHNKKDTPMPTAQTKYFITNTNGFFINWSSDLTNIKTQGQAAKIKGAKGDDSIYVGRGTKVDATELTSTEGNDHIYLTGNFADYTQSNFASDGTTKIPQYTFSRKVMINGVEFDEELTFILNDGDKLHFADGHVNIDMTGALGGANGFPAITSTNHLVNSEATDVNNPLAGQRVFADNGATKVFITDTDSQNILTAVQGTSTKIKGAKGDDSVYVNKGTKVDATELTSTEGNDHIYLTGNFADYTQSNFASDGTTKIPQYTFSRKVMINGVEFDEELTFILNDGDKLHFADGHVKIDMTGALGGANGFPTITSTHLEASESTPGLGIGLTITDDKANAAKIGEDITYTFTFSEAVKDFAIGDINISNNATIKASTSLVPTTSGANKDKVWTLVITPNANAQGDITINVAKEAANALTGNLKSAAASNTQSFDTNAPTLIISDDKADGLTLKTGDIITYTFTFSEAVTGFDKNTIGIINGAIKQGSDLVASTGADAGKVYTLTVVPGSNLEAGSNLTVSVSANNAITDSAGNTYSIATANNIQAVDTKAPTAALSGNMAANANLTMTFIEAVTINIAGSIIIYEKDNPTNIITIDIKNQVSIDSTHKIISINPGSDLTTNKDYYVKIDAGTFKDTAGNNYEGINSNNGWSFLVSSFTTTAQWVDTTGTSVSDNGINAAELSTLTIQGTLTNSGGAAGVVISSITFKATSGTTANDRVVETSNLPTFASTDSTQWTLANNKIPTLVSNETYTIEINLSSTGGGTSTGGNTTPVLIDTTAPAITEWTVSSPINGQSDFKVGDVITLTMTTNETLLLSNASSSKVTINNKEWTLDTTQGAAKTGASADELKQLVFTYTVQLNDSTSKADFEITNVNAIALTGVTDAVGNTVTTTGTYPIELNRGI
ncbi:MAG: hypothetical protein FE834_06690, partial [Gammaproteobacteria bacterium]|nr:hypothetical protein [Gammaproteobacteria bacterium]